MTCLTSSGQGSYRCSDPEVYPERSTPLFTIGDDPDEPLHLVIGAVLTDDALILAEESTYSLRFYDRATGRLLRAVGQKGEGPGDYGNTVQMALSPTASGRT